MGKRSPIEGTVGILSAFLRRRTWQQSELARELDLESRTVRRHLNELQRWGFPLEREDDPPQVYWRMPKDWFPGGVLLKSTDATLLIQLLCRMPASTARDTLLRLVSAGLSRQDNPAPQLESVFHGVGAEARFVALVSDAAVARSTLHVRYYTASRGAMEWRNLSVQRVLPGPPARIVAHCHRSDRLKWFRVDGIMEARLEPNVPYVSAATEDIDDYLAKSLDGFAADDDLIEHRFFVADPDARWVRNNLLPPMIAEPVSGGMIVRCRTTAAPRLARFVLGLAPAARAETPELVTLVTELATSALAQHQRAKVLRQGTKRQASPSPSSTDQRDSARSSKRKPERARRRSG